MCEDMSELLVVDCGLGSRLRLRLAVRMLAALHQMAVRLTPLRSSGRPCDDRRLAGFGNIVPLSSGRLSFAVLPGFAALRLPTHDAALDDRPDSSRLAPFPSPKSQVPFPLSSPPQESVQDAAALPPSRCCPTPNECRKCSVLPMCVCSIAGQACSSRCSLANGL